MRRSSRTWTSTSRPTSTRCSRSSRRWCPGTPTSRSAPDSRRARPSRGTRSASSSRARTTLLLRTVFATPVRDAQCGFKAVRADVARRLLPAIEDDEWFFDTELLLLARHNGLARARSAGRLGRRRRQPRRRASAPRSTTWRASSAWPGTFWTGGGRVDLGDATRRQLEDDFGRRLVLFGAHRCRQHLRVARAVPAPARTASVPSVANAVAVTATFVANTWANARFTARRRRAQLGGGARRSTLGALALTSCRAAPRRPRRRRSRRRDRRC